MNLIESLGQITDPRRKAGMRYGLVPMLLIAIMSIITGNTGYREMERFTKVNPTLFKKFFTSKTQHLPSHVTFREIIKNIDFEEVLEIFHKWTQQYVTIERKEFLSIDGKSLNSTVTDYSDSYQNFVSMVSVFLHKRGQVIAMKQLENKKSSEIPTVQELIELLDLKDVVYTLDALHCQKKLWI